MPNYDIYVLGESQITVSGGGQLDGITQGDGSHLAGRTITLNSGAWAPISVRDDDVDFQDNDTGQRLNGAQTVDGISFADNTIVEAEFGLVVTDGTNSWTLVGFNVNNSNPAYATIEGLAFIGGPGGFPPVGVPLSVVSTSEGPNYAATTYATPVCLVAGTQVRVAQGLCAIEEIRPGDMVQTRDHGWQPVRWVGCRRVAARAAFAPVRIAAGTLGNRRDLWVSQQHRVLLEGWQAELLFGATQVLVPAVHLVNDDTIRVVPGGAVTYVHLLFDGHEVIETEGCWTESLFVGAGAMAALLPAARDEVLALFPELADGGAAQYGETAYPVLRGFEAAMLARMVSGGGARPAAVEHDHR